MCNEKSRERSTEPEDFEAGIESYPSQFSFIETPLDPCWPNPCQNDGTCSGNADGFTCSCASGYTGNDCGTNGLLDSIKSSLF